MSRQIPVVASLTAILSVLSLASAEPVLEERKYIKVCPVGQTTSCRQIGYSDPTPPAVESNVVIPSIYKPGQDYTWSEIAPAITAAPNPTDTGSMTFYTSYSQASVSKNLVVIPIIVPIPVDEPIPPVIPEGDAPETLDLPEGTDLPESETPPSTSNGPTSTPTSNNPSSSTPTSTNPSSSTISSSAAGGSCTKPTPAPQSAPVSPVKQTGVTVVETTGTDAPTSTQAPSSTLVSGNCPASSPTSPIPGCWGQPGCAYVIASDLGSGAACSVDYCNCGGTNVPLLTQTVSGSASLGCAYTTQPASNNCPTASGTPKASTTAPASTGGGGFTLDPKAFPTVTGSACFAPAGAAPSGQKEFHTERASAVLSSACSGEAASQTAGLLQPTNWFAEVFFDYPDGSSTADLSTDLNLFATSDGGDNINFADDCVTGFNNALNNCPTADDGGTWGGAVSYNGVEYSIYGTDASTSSKKRTIAIGNQQIELPQGAPRETHLYAYADCPEAHGCDTGYAIADHYSFSPASICDTDTSELMFHSIASGGSSNMRFKSFGHEGCSLDPSESGNSELFGSLDCGSNLAGSCKTPSDAEALPQLCVKDADEVSAVKNGTVFQMMAICRF